MIDFLRRAHALQDAVRTGAAKQLVSSDDPLLHRLAALDEELARSYRQALTDLSDPSRLTFLGPAGEIREVMRAVIHKLAPDKEVKKQAWFKGDEHGRPTQAERIRHVVQGGSDWETASDAAVTIEEQVGKLGRVLYGRASKAFHSGTELQEVNAILGYVRALLNDILPHT